MRHRNSYGKLRWARTALQTARRRAIAGALAFEITTADIMSRAGDLCPALGIELDYSRGRRVIQDNSPTVDRLIPALGYVPGNIEVISNKANACKSRCEPGEILDIGRWLLRALTPTMAAGVVPVAA